MKILIIGQYFEPERAAGANRMRRFVDALKNYHKVKVITGMPCYPTGKLTRKYRGRTYISERRLGVDVLRTYEYATPNEGGFLRVLNYISFFVSSIIGSFWVGPCDVVIATSPPLSVALSGYIVAKFKRAKFIFDVRDLWPESIIEYGYAKDGVMIKIIQGIAQWLYRKSDIIITATPGMERYLKSKNYKIKNTDKISTLMNTVDTSLFRPQKVSRSKYGYRKKDFIVSYIGNFGKAYDFEMLIRVAKALPNIKFMLVGDGEERAKLIDLVKKYSIKNVDMYKSVLYKDVSKEMKMSSVAFMPLAKSHLINSVIPTKTFEYLACGVPVVSTGGTDIKKIIEKNNCGYVVSDNVDSIIAKIIQIKNSKNKYKKMCKNARETALKYSDKMFKKLINKIIDEI